MNLALQAKDRHFNNKFASGGVTDVQLKVTGRMNLRPAQKKTVSNIKPNGNA
jgi:hypothetical protein